MYIDGKRAAVGLKWNLPYWNRYKVGWWTPLHLEVKKGFEINYTYGWYSVDFMFLVFELYFEWRVFQ